MIGAGAWILLAVSAAQGPTDAQCEAYARFQEFHFEFRWDAAGRAKYIQLLREDVAAGKLKEDVGQAEATLATWTKSDMLTILGTHSNLRQADSAELFTEQSLNNGSIPGKGIAAQTRREVKDGCKSSKFLLDSLAAYDKPVRGDGNIYTSLFQREMDATYDWTVFRLRAVGAPALWDGSEANRKAVRQAFVCHWDALAKDAAKQQSWRGLLQLNLPNWLVWRLGDYKFLAKMSRYQQAEALSTWAQELVSIFPTVKPTATRQSAELQKVIKSLTPAEVKAEFERARKLNAKFSVFMAQRQQAAAEMQQSVSQMRQAMTQFHVANLNISENLGDTGFRWTLTSP